MTGESPVPAVQVDAALSINMTYDREVGFPVKAIAIVPNNVAPWVSSLFLIDDDNKLHRGAIDAGAFDNVAKDIAGIAPLARNNDAGIALAHTHTGEVKAFLEINDDSDYRAMPLSETPHDIDAFCAVDHPSAARVYAKSGPNILTLELTSPQENSYIGAAPINGLKARGKTCSVITDAEDLISLDAPKTALGTAVLDSNTLLFITKDSQSAPRLFIKRGEDVTAINITGGITMAAPKQIDALYVMPNSMGGVLRNGALVLADNETQRLIYISLDFFKQRVDEIFAP